MQKIGLYALLAIVVFALVFALLPVSRTESPTGATLQGVQLRLYPARDPDTVWSFRAAHVTSDPVTNETHLRTLSGGQRVVKERDNKGMLTGRETLDARLSAPELTIDAQDNMLTRQARITLVRECADIDLTGTPEQPVKIEQGSGFSAAVAKVDSPVLNGTINRLRMSFQFVLEESAEDSQTSFSLNPTEQCINGKRVPVPSS